MSAITLAVANGSITTTSNQVADHFGKRHDNLLQAIDKLGCSEDFRLLNFQETFQVVATPNGGARTDREVTMTRDGFTILCMGFTGRAAMQWKEKYIAAFNAMERALKNPARVSAAKEPAPKLLKGKSPVDLYFAALQLYAGNYTNKAALWLGLSEVVFAKLGIKGLDGITDANLDEAIYILADDMAVQQIGMQAGSHYLKHVAA